MTVVRRVAAEGLGVEAPGQPRPLPPPLGVTPCQSRWSGKTARTTASRWHSASTAAGDGARGGAARRARVLSRPSGRRGRRGLLAVPARAGRRCRRTSGPRPGPAPRTPSARSSSPRSGAAPPRGQASPPPRPPAPRCCPCGRRSRRRRRSGAGRPLPERSDAQLPADLPDVGAASGGPAAVTGQSVRAETGLAADESHDLRRQAAGSEASLRSARAHTSSRTRAKRLRSLRVPPTNAKSSGAEREEPLQLLVPIGRRIVAPRQTSSRWPCSKRSRPTRVDNLARHGSPRLTAAGEASLTLRGRRPRGVDGQ